MPESSMNQVAMELLRRPTDLKVSWEETARRDSYRVVFPDLVLTIRKIRKFPDEGSEFKLEQMIETGRVVHSLDTTPGLPMNIALRQIYESAEQHIRDRGINKALEYLKLE